MAKSILPAAGAGFKLIVTRPVSVLAWAVVYLVLFLGPTATWAYTAFPKLAQFAQAMQVDPQNPNPEAISTLLGAFAMFPLILLCIALGSGIVYTAIMRAVLFPEKKAWFFLRFGTAELRTLAIGAILVITYGIVYTIASTILTIPFAASMALSGATADTGRMMGQVLLMQGINFLIMIALAWPFGRLAMAVPMSIAENRFRLFEAWKFTRGYGWQILLLFVLIMIILVILELVVYGGVAGFAYSLTDGFNPDKARALLAEPRKMISSFIGLGVVYVLFVAILTPVVTAPWARAYQIIAGRKTEDEHTVFE